ncbi:MAG: hypothetical protein ACKVN9_04105 [Methylophilaceae bacterium]
MKHTIISQDLVVAEIHAVREGLANQYQNDLAAYSAAAEAHCRKLGFVIAESPRRQPHDIKELVESA